VVLGAAERLDALAVRGAVRVDVLGDGRRADEADGSDARMSRMLSTASLSPWTTLKTPLGRPACWSISASRMEALGSRSDGLRMKALPQAMARGAIQSGTMAGKLNGVMPATTPSGWRSDQESMPEPTCSVNSPLEELRDAGGELDVFEGAGGLALGVGEDLAVLGG
jgi:hypothetical protein